MKRLKTRLFPTLYTMKGTDRIRKLTPKISNRCQLNCLNYFRDKLEDYSRDQEYRDGFYYEHYGKYIAKKYRLEFSTLRKILSTFVNCLHF